MRLSHGTPVRMAGCSGAAPTRPTAAWTFWDCTACTTSLGVMSRLAVELALRLPSLTVVRDASNWTARGAGPESRVASIAATGAPDVPGAGAGAGARQRHAHAGAGQCHRRQGRGRRTAVHPHHRLRQHRPEDDGGPYFSNVKPTVEHGPFAAFFPLSSFTI